MSLKDEGTFRKNMPGNTGRLYVPAALTRDSHLLFDEGRVKIRICDLCDPPHLCVMPQGDR